VIIVVAVMVAVGLYNPSKIIDYNAVSQTKTIGMNVLIKAIH